MLSLKGLAWLGLHHDGEIVYQSDRYARHQGSPRRLCLDSGQAYHCLLQALKELQVIARLSKRAAGLQIRYKQSSGVIANPREAPPGHITNSGALKTSREGQNNYPRRYSRSRLLLITLNLMT